MAIYHQPSGDQKFYDLIRSFRPQGSTTVVWVQDMTTGQLIRMLRWGNEIYLPVYDGMRIGIGVYNGGPTWRAYPSFIEARNMWDNGQSQPEDCDTNHMWELKPWQSMVMDKLMNPDRPVGRPFIIHSVGSGLTIGEATFGTTEFRGQIRLYERLQIGGGYQPQRPANSGYGTRGVTRGGVSKGLESFEPTLGGDMTRGFHPESFSLGGDLTPKGPAGIGAGAETHQNHTDTGMSYQRNAQPVISLRVEYREDLQPMLNMAWNNIPWNWYEPMPYGESWWDQDWTWRPARPTAPEIPVIRPHRPC